MLFPCLGVASFLRFRSVTRATLALALLGVLCTAASAQSGFQVLRSASSNRASPSPLAGAVISGNLYAFTAPDAGITRVRFFLDDPALSGTPARVENNAPFDFNGGSATTAIAYPTGTLPDGAHMISAEITLADGGLEVLHATFTVANIPASFTFAPAALVLSVAQGAAAEPVTIALSSSPAAVSYALDESTSWLAVGPASGTTPAAPTVTFDIAGLAPGSYAGSITATGAGLPPRVLPVSLVIEIPPPLVVDTLVDESDGSCADGDCSLRDAIALADADAVPREVRFAIDGTIALLLGPLTLAGGDTTITGSGRAVTIAGGPEEGGAVIEIASSGNRIEDLSITGGGHGVSIAGSGNILSRIGFSAAGGSGIAVPAPPADGNTFDRCVFQGNGGLAIDLGAPGPGLGGVGVQGGAAHPILASANVQTAAGTACPACFVEIYVAEPDPSGHGEGQTIVAAVFAASNGSFVAPLAGLVAGDAITAIATDPAGNTSEFAANVEVAPLPHDLLFSRFADRSSPAPLAGRVLSGPIRVFTAPDDGVTRVRYHLDDPAPLGTPFRIEGSAPFDFAGGTVAAANPYSTSLLPDGPHTITAVLELTAGGTFTVDSAFTVANSPAPPTGLVVPGELVAIRDLPISPIVPTSSGGPVESYSIAPPLPSGLALDPVSGIIAGTPVALAVPTTHIITATNATASATAAIAITVVAGAPEIVAGPASLAVCPGAPAAFAVTVSASMPFTLQWRRDGAEIPGETGTSLAIAAAAAGDAGEYDVVVSHAGGSVVSAPAFLTILEPPSVLAAGGAIAGCAGSPVTFEAGVSGSPPFSHQWRKDGAPIPGATGTSLTIPVTAVSDAGSYDVVVTNPCGVAIGDVFALAIDEPPSIAAEPADRTVCSGGAASFSIAVSGSPPLFFQWRKDGATIPGATGADLTLASVTPADAGAYDAVVTNSCGVATCAPVELEVETSPVITATPGPRSACLGETVIFSVAAEGSAEFQVVWQKDGVDLPAGGATLVLPSVGAGDAGSYGAVLSNDCGSATIAGALLTVHPPAAITVEPVGVVLCEGEPFALSVAATGTEPLSFEWRRDGIPVPGQTGSSFAVAAAAAADSGAYAAQVGDSCGTVTSASAAVVVRSLAAIAVPPSPLSICAGESAQFSVTASGTPPFSYQWRRGGTPIPGGTGETLGIAAVLPSDAGSYDVVVTNACGAATSAAATLLVRAPPTVIDPPDDISVAEGAPAVFSALAAGESPLSYQWRKDGVPVPGATSTSIVIASVAPSHAGQYDVVAANACGMTVSAAATLTVSAGAPPESVSYPTPLSFVENVSIAPISPSTSGGPVLSFSVSPDLPIGLVLHAATGVISGTPSAPAAPVGYLVTASNGAGSVSTTVVIEVLASTSYELRVSETSTFAVTANLEGQIVDGGIYVRFEPTAGVDSIAFHLDDPALESPPLRVEVVPPFDLAGASGSVPLPFDTTQLAEGSHLLTAVADLADGGAQVIEANFTVRNDPNGLRFLPSTVALHAVAGETGMRSASVRIDTTDGDSPLFELGIPSAPWLAVAADSSTLPATLAVTAEIGGVAAGLHEAVITVTSAGYAPEELRVFLAVDSGIPGLSHSVSRHGITWTFSSEAEVGTFANGDRYVIAPVEVLAVDPEWDGVHHGSMVNPVHGELQGYDARFSFDPSLRAAIPRILLPGESLVSTESWPGDDPAAPSSDNKFGIPRPALRRAAVLTALASHPAPDALRPPYGGSAKPLHRVSELDLGILPSLPATPTAPDVDDFSPFLGRLWLDHLRRFPNRYLHPSENMHDYDRDVAADYNAAALLTLCDIPAAEKLELLTPLVQIGIDIHAILETGATYGDGGGGFGSGRKWPVLFAGLLLGDVAMQNVGLDYGPVHSLEDCQTFYLSAAEAPHFPDDGGTSEFSAPATVGVPGHEVLFSLTPDRASPVALDGATVSGSIYAFASPEPGVRRVRFYLDNPAATGTPYRTENNPPFDLAGGPATLPAPFSTLSLANGPHSVTASIDFFAGGSTVVTAFYVVSNQAPALQFAPSALHLVAAADGAVPGADLLIESNQGAVTGYTLAADDPWLAVSAASGTTPAIVTVSIDSSDLDPGAHATTITATSPNHFSRTITVTVTVPAAAGGSDLVVNSLADELDGSCEDGDCSLRDALAIANGNGDEDEIRFSVTGTIALLLGPLVLAESRTRVIGPGQQVTIDAAPLAGLPAIVLAADDCDIEGLVIAGAAAGAPGIVITGGGNRLTGNRIAGNSGSGIAVVAGAGPRNHFRSNALAGNGGPGIDLGSDGAGNAPGGPNAGIQPPVLTAVTTQGASGTAAPGVTVEVFRVDASGDEGEVSLGISIADAEGAFLVPISGVLAGSSVTAIASAGVPLGTPVWGERHCFPQADYQDPGNLAYRTCCTANGWVGAALGAHILGARGLWNHEPFFDYMDRYMAEFEPGAWERSWSSFAEEMWDAYRADYGPVWVDSGGAGGGG